MTNVPNKRTLTDILLYIKKASDGGILKESMMTMAVATGYSNATIHRAVKSLEADGFISVIPRKAPRHPNTIVYIGPDTDDVDYLLKQAHDAMTNLTNASSEVKIVVSRMQEFIALLDNPGQAYIDVR